MATSKYYGHLSKKKPDAETETTTELNMPSNPIPEQPQIGASDLAGALDRIATVIDRKLASLPVLERDFEVKPDVLSNEDEWKQCDNALDRDFIKVDDKGQDCDSGKYYKVIHNYPMFQTSNAAENIAYVVVEKWTFAEDGSGGKRRQKLGSFNMKYRDFAKQYKTTMAG